MAINKTGTASNGTAGASTSITIPAGTLVGDVMLIFAHSYKTSAVTTPSGWNHKVDTTAITNNGLASLFWRVATAGDTGGATTVSIAGGSIFTDAMFISYSGVNTSTPFDVTNTRINTSSVTSDTFAGITTTVDGDQIVYGVVATPQVGGAHTWSATPGTSQVSFNSTGNADGNTSDHAQATHGATGSVTATLGGTTPSSNWFWIATSLQPASTAAATPVGLVHITPVPWRKARPRGGARLLLTGPANGASVILPPVTVTPVPWRKIRPRLYTAGPLYPAAAIIASVPKGGATITPKQWRKVVRRPYVVRPFPGDKVVYPVPNSALVVVSHPGRPYLRKKALTVLGGIQNARAGGGFPQDVYTKPGWRPQHIRKSREAKPGFFTSDQHIILTNTAGPALAYVTVQVIPRRISLNGQFTDETETVFKGADGTWFAFVSPVNQFSDPGQFYLIVEHFNDGHYQAYKATIPAGTAPGSTVRLKDVLR